MQLFAEVYVLAMEIWCGLGQGTKAILNKLNFTPDQIEEICEIIAHHHSPGAIITKNFGILYDADWIVNLKDGYGIEDKIKLRNIIERVLLTDSGKALAREIYL